MNPLTIYPKHPSAPDTYHIGGAWTPACITAVEKRFRTSELAAEYWRKNGDFESCAEGYSIANDGYAYESEGVEAGRLNTLRRFATLDHYDEYPA